jgi:peptide/nickel transport system permease protein
VGAICLLGLCAPLLASHDPNEQNLSAILSPPSQLHFLGTDELGRDVLSRLLYGARYVFSVAAWAAFLPLVAGVPLGLVTGFSARWASRLDWFVEFLMPLPDLLLTLLVASMLGPSLEHALLALSITFTPVIARLVRSEVRQATTSTFVLHLRASGFSPRRIVFGHLLRHVIGPLLVQTTLNLGLGVTATAGLGYLGLGAQPPTPEWGVMLSTATIYLATRPVMAGAYALMIALTSLSFQLMGEEGQKMLARQHSRSWNPFLHATVA